MPRTSRVVLPNYPHHIIQRGHNRQAVFIGDEDYLYYLENLKYCRVKGDRLLYWGQLKIGTASVPRVMPNLYYEVEVLSWQETTRHVAWRKREKGDEKKEKKGTDLFID